MEWDKFWSINKKKYEPTAHRYMGVFKDTCVELHIEDASVGEVGDIVAIPVALHPKVCSISVCVCVCVCVFIKLHITTQSGPVILVILCHSH